MPPRVDEHAVARELDCLEAIGLLAGRVAHDVNNPLAGIQNSFMLVKDAIPSTHPHYRYVEAIEREIARIAVVTRRLVDNYPAKYDRALTGSVGAVAAEAVRLAQGAPAVARVDVVTENHLDGALIAEPALLRQVLRQLLSTALRAPDQDEPVCFDLRRDGTHLVVHIRYFGELPTASFADPYPARLIAALGGSWEVDHVGPRAVVISLRVPMPDPG